MEKLKPCPFCGAEDENIVVDKYVARVDNHTNKVRYRYRVICTKCMATVDPGYFQEYGYAVIAWNRRADK